MQIKILAVAKKSRDWVAEAEADFAGRIQNFAKIETELTPPLDENSLGAEKARETESEKLFEKIKDDDFVIACDRNGKSLDSESFAKKLGELRDDSQKIVFLIGGSNGLNQKILERADLQISFSAFTFPHELFRIMLLEQIYRAVTILKNKKYHK